MRRTKGRRRRLHHPEKLTVVHLRELRCDWLREGIPDAAEACPRNRKNPLRKLSSAALQQFR
jgi:hypothetical protein